MKFGMMFGISAKFQYKLCRCQGQSSRSKPLCWKSNRTIALLWFNLWFTRFGNPTKVIFGTKYDFRQNSRWRPGGGFVLSERFLVLVWKCFSILVLIPLSKSQLTISFFIQFQFLRFQSCSFDFVILFHTSHKARENSRDHQTANDFRRPFFTF